MASFQTEIERFLGSEEANHGLETVRCLQLIEKIPHGDDEAYKSLLPALLPPKEGGRLSIEEQAAKSYRAMTILKQDLSTGPPIFIRGPTQAGLLVKDLLVGLALVAADDSQRFRTFHMRELLDALVEKYPEKAMSAAAAGGKDGVQEHLLPLLRSDQTLSVLTHLVCIGATGRKGIASAEKSAQHTAMYNHMQNNSKNKVSLGLRRKFVKAMAEFSLIDTLADALASKPDGEELCETLLTIVEVVGYPPEDPLIPGQVQPEKEKTTEELVGEDILLAPLGTPEWWEKLLSVIHQNSCTYEQREAIARVCHHVFALATGNSTRICKSHAPATDATEQTSENIVEEKEEKVVNRLVEWGLTNKIHAALQSQLPLLIQVLDLPSENIMSHQATLLSKPGELSDGEVGETHLIRHPGRYRTQPLGSWRLQLLSLLKEILTYHGKSSSNNRPPCAIAMDLIMELPIPPEVVKSKKSKGGSDKPDDVSRPGGAMVYNPWPALCSFVWSYPNNDFYHITFFQMLQSVVVQHHESSLRLILQKSKFLSRAVNSLKDETLRGTMMNCLNLLKLRSESLAPSAFLHQYLGSHDGWKENVDQLVGLTLAQQKPIKSEGGEAVVDLNLGSPFASKLGLSDLKDWDATTSTTVSESSMDEMSEEGLEDSTGGDGGNDTCGGTSYAGTKKKKKNKKKKKK